MSCTFNISKGKIQLYYEEARTAGNKAIIVMLLKSAGIQVDATLADYVNVSTLLAATNDEADFTNYARKTITGSDPVLGVPLPVIDNAGNRALLDIPDQTWVDAGGNPVVLNNTLARVLIAYDANTTIGTDADLIPLSSHDIVATTDGNDLIIRFHVDGAIRVL